MSTPEILSETSEDRYKKLISTLFAYSKVGCFIIAFLSTLVLVGWSINNTLLESILPGYAVMNPLTAICLIALSTALFLRIGQSNLSSRRFWLINLLCFFVFVVGLTSFLKLLGLDFRIDTLLFHDSVGNSRIAPNTGINFIFMSAAFMVFNRNFSRTFWLTQFFTLSAGLVTMIVGVGYVFDVLSFYQVPMYPAMALNTLSAFYLLCLSSLFSTSGYGIMKVITSQFEISILARRMLLIIVFVPIILGLFHVIHQQFNLQTLDPSKDAALMVIAGIIIFSGSVWISTNLLYKNELEKIRIADALKQQTQMLEKKDEELSEKVEELEKAKKEISDLLNHEDKLTDAFEGT